MTCPNCERSVDKLDIYWLENFGECARCDRERVANAVMARYQETEDAE